MELFSYLLNHIVLLSLADVIFVAVRPEPALEGGLWLLFPLRFARACYSECILALRDIRCLSERR